MYFPFSIWLIVIIFATIVIFSFIHHIIKAFLVLVTVILVSGVIILLITGYSVSKDFSDISHHLGDSKNLFLISIDGTIETGYVVEGNTSNGLTQAELEPYQHKTDFFDQVQYYKIFVIKDSALESITAQKTVLNGHEITQDQLKSVLRSNDPQTLFEQITQLHVTEPSDPSLFKLFVLNRFMNSDDIFGIPLILSINEGNAEVFPKTPAIRFLEEIPTSFLRSRLEDIKNQIEDRANKFRGEV